MSVTFAAVSPSSSDTVTYGSLDLPKSAQSDFDRAVTYLSRDSVERDLFARLEHGRTPIHLITNHHGDDHFDVNTHTITWDPHSALMTSDRGHQTPALGLGHEVDHAVNSSRNTIRLANTYDVRYDNLEERRVITGSETHAARTLGESVRRDHGGTTYSVSSPTAW